MGEAFAWLKGIFVGAIDYFHDLTGSYTLAIILVTIAIRLLVAPLFVVQQKSMKRMQEVQPEIARLREKHKKDPEKLNKEMMELYRKEKVNPFAGCLPLLIQFPFLIAIYQAIYSKQYGEAIFGLISLDKPDPTFILPILSGGFTFLQTWLSGSAATDPTQKTMLYVMPVFIAWITKTMPAGVALYWVVSTLVGIIQQGIYPGFRRAPKPKGDAGAK